MPQAKHAKSEPAVDIRELPVLDLSKLTRMEIGTLVYYARQAAFETQQQAQELQYELAAWYLEVRQQYLPKFFEVT